MVEVVPVSRRSHNAQSVPLIFMLYVISFGWYFFVWAYKTWKFIRDETGYPLNPLLRTVALWVPIAHEVFLFGLFKEVKDLTTDAEEQTDDLVSSRMPGMDYKMILFWLAFSVSTYFLAAQGWPVLIGFASVLFIVPLQRRINRYSAWKHDIRPAKVSIIVWIVLVPLGLLAIAARVAA